MRVLALIPVDPCGCAGCVFEDVPCPKWNDWNPVCEVESDGGVRRKYSHQFRYIEVPEHAWLLRVKDAARTLSKAVIAWRVSVGPERHERAREMRLADDALMSVLEEECDGR